MDSPHVCIGNCKCKIPRIKKDIVHAKARSGSQERDIAKNYKDIGFSKSRRIPMSGALQTLKGDVDPGELLLVEAKQSRQGSLRIDPKWYDKIEMEAKAAGRPWAALHAWVAEGEDNYRKVVIISEKTWFDLLEQLKRHE